MPCAHQIIRPPRPWASEALGWGDCITCTAGARNAECPGYHDVPEPDKSQTGPHAKTQRETDSDLLKEKAVAVLGVFATLRLGVRHGLENAPAAPSGKPPIAA